MADSAITVAGLVAARAVNQVKLSWTYDDPHANGNAYLALDAVEVHAASSNDRSLATKVGEGLTDFNHSGIPEEESLFYAIRARNKSIGVDGITRYYGDWYPSDPNAMIPGKALGMSGLAFGFANGKIVVDDNASDAAVPSGALRVALKTSSGNDPSSDDPVFISIPEQSAGAGSYVIRKIDYPVENTIGSGSTLAATADVPFAVWILGVDDGSSIQLGLVNSAGPFNKGPDYVPVIDESTPVNVTFAGAVGSTGDANQVYTPVAIATPSPFRVLGSMVWESGLATPGTWVRPTTTMLYARGMTKPGEVVKTYYGKELTVVATNPTTDVIPYDDTIPQENEGKDAASFLFSIQSAVNWTFVEFTALVSTDVDDHVIGSIYQDTRGSVDALGVGVVWCPAGKQVELYVCAMVRPGSDSVRFGLNLGQATSGTTVTMNGVGGGRKFGGLSETRAKITEIVG